MNGTLDLIHQRTGATLITFDRSGFGKSELNLNTSEDIDFGIINGREELETDLTKLGYGKDIILVGHSLETLYSILFATRHLEKTNTRFC